MTVGIIACVVPTTTIITTGTTPVPTTAVPSTTIPLSSTTAPSVIIAAAPVVQTLSTGAPSTAGTSLPSATTTTLPPTTTTMNYCTAEQGMNQPLTITPDQVNSNPSPQPTTPLTGINPTSTTPGVDFPTPNPQITVTLDQPTTLTLIYLPVDRPNQPSNVVQFQVVFVYPDGTTSQPFTSTTPSPIFTTPGTTTIVPPSNASPQVDLPPNFQVPQNTTIVITITSTISGSNPTGVCKDFFSHSLLTSVLNIRYFWKYILSGSDK